MSKSLWAADHPTSSWGQQAVAPVACRSCTLPPLVAPWHCEQVGTRRASERRVATTIGLQPWTGCCCPTSWGKPTAEAVDARCSIF